jgi:hypothetical protein
VPLICDEFGVYRNFSPPESHEHWLTGARSAFEKNHIGWTMWDYQGGFGVVYKENGAMRDDEVVPRQNEFLGRAGRGNIEQRNQPGVAGGEPLRPVSHENMPNSEPDLYI